MTSLVEHGTVGLVEWEGLAVENTDFAIKLSAEFQRDRFLFSEPSDMITVRLTQEHTETFPYVAKLQELYAKRRIYTEGKDLGSSQASETGWPCIRNAVFGRLQLRNAEAHLLHKQQGPSSGHLTVY